MSHIKKRFDWRHSRKKEHRIITCSDRTGNESSVLFPFCCLSMFHDVRSTRSFETRKMRPGCGWFFSLSLFLSVCRRCFVLGWRWTSFSSRTICLSPVFDLSTMTVYRDLSPPDQSDDEKPLLDVDDVEKNDLGHPTKSFFQSRRLLQTTSLLYPILLASLLIIGTILLVVTVTRRNICHQLQEERELDRPWKLVSADHVCKTERRISIFPLNEIFSRRKQRFLVSNFEYHHHHHRDVSVPHRI